jgi:uncharacterized membrane protein
MISATPLLTGLTMVLLCLAFATVLLPLNKLPLAVRLLVIVGITLSVLLPLSDYPGWYYVRSVFGDCSITALFFYVALILQQHFSLQLYQENELVLLRRLVLAAAILLYPFALGLTQFDSYSPGFTGPWLLAVLLLITLFCWYKKYYFLAVALTAGVTAWSLQLLESLNLWDYLIDPALLLIMILTWARPSVKNIFPYPPCKNHRCS